MNDEFQVTLDLDQKYPVLHMAGDITGGAEAHIRDCFGTIPDEKRDLIVFNFKSTEYINSAGIAILISLITQTQENKGRIVFCDLNPHFRKVMDIVGLTDFVKIYSDIDEALNH